MKELKKIIYAEDEADIRTIVQMIFESMSTIKIDFAENGIELLKKVQDEDYDLIILDVMMPEMDGPTTMRELRKLDKTKDIPVIFMTAKAQLKELEEFKQMGIIGIITKPFEPMQLYPVITDIWKENNE